MDRRLYPANDHVADISLQGQVQGLTLVDPAAADIAVPVADLLRAPGGARDRQLQWGAPVRVLDERGGWAFIRSELDGYVGYVAADHLAAAMPRTHRVAALATHLYPEPNMKVRQSHWLGFGARLRVVSASGNFFETEDGFFVPKPHLRPLKAPMRDPVTIAQMHFGVPYLWGGNSAAGIDCSGLVQAALLACDIACPGDSDLQEAALGESLAPGTPAQRGDLFFWKGHVAMAVDDQIMIHANAFHMAVSYEPIADAIARIQDQGDGPVTSHKRISAEAS